MKKAHGNLGKLNRKPLPAGSVGGFLVCTLAVALFT